MSAFLTNVRVEILPPNEVSGRQQYILTAPFVYESEILGRIEVPPGFKTDFASIPRIAWRYIDPEDPAILYPSVVHDFLYSQPTANEVRPWTREQADQVLREAMVLAGARIDQRAIVYRMVRLFGGSHWKTL